MRIDKNYPKPIELKETEIKTLDFLRNNPFVNTNFSMLAKAANDTHEAFKSKQRLQNHPFRFEAYFDFPHKKKDYRFHFGVEISSKKDNRNHDIHDKVSYYLAICDSKKDKNKFRLLRQFHFDYDISGHQNDHPIFHLQYAGKLSPSLMAHNYVNNQMHPWLSEPRLHHHPVTLALLINLVFKEFKRIKLVSLLTDDRWRGIVQNNEELVLKPYFEQCNTFMTSRHTAKDHLFTDNFCYGK